MRIKKKLLLLFLSLYFLNTYTYANNKLILAIGEQEHSTFNNISKKILKEAYQKIGIDISFKAIPAKRALIMSNMGTIDGEIHRILDIEKEYKNLIRVPVPINKIDVIVFSKNKELKITKIDDLKPYRIGIRRGVQFAENLSNGMNVNKVKNIEQLFLLLQLGRIDVAIETSFAGIKTIKKLNFNEIHMSKPPIISKKLYHYLNKKHKKIIPLLTKSLKEMEEKNIIEEKYIQGTYKLLK